MRNSISKRMSSRFAALPRSGGGVRVVKLALGAALLVAAAGAQPSSDWIIDTFAGLPDIRDHGPAIDARLDAPSGVVLDGAGNLYIADTGNHRIRKVDSSGVITTIAGTGERGFGGDGGPAAAAQLWSPADVVLDGAGNLYIADRGNQRVRKVDSSGVITTIAGTGESGFGGDGGPAVQAQLNSPWGVVADGIGNLYIADRYSHRIRKVDSSGIITTFAGTGESGFSGDGDRAVQAQLRAPTDLALDGADNLYITDTGNRRVRKVDSSGTITTFAGTGDPWFGGDGGPAVAAQLWSPYGVSVDGAGNLYITDTSHHRVRKVDSSGVISTVAGSREHGYSGDGGQATAARLQSPRSVAVSGTDNLYIADANNHRIRKVNSSGVISTITGSVKPGDGGRAINAQLRSPTGVAVDGADNLYIADANDHRIRKVDFSGVIATLAGTGARGFGGDGGPATAAQLQNPWGVATDGMGNLYIADTGNDRIRRVDATGTITTIAGTGEHGDGGDGGRAVQAQLDAPWDVAVDAAGNLYIADTNNRRIRKVDSSGVITTIAGTGERGFGGDGNRAVAAQLSSPFGVATDDAGNLYIADTGNHRIRKVNSSGIITTVAGTGERGFSGDGDRAIAAQLSSPYGVATDDAGNLYIADTGNHRIRKVDSSGTISSITGTGVRGFGGDGGPAAAAILDVPREVALDSAGNLYIADASNHRIRVLTRSTDSGGERAPLLEEIRGLLPF